MHALPLVHPFLRLKQHEVFPGTLIYINLAPLPWIRPAPLQSDLPQVPRTAWLPGIPLLLHPRNRGSLQGPHLALKTKLLQHLVGIRLGTLLIGLLLLEHPVRRIRIGTLFAVVPHVIRPLLGRRNPVFVPVVPLVGLIPDRLTFNLPVPVVSLGDVFIRRVRSTRHPSLRPVRALVGFVFVKMVSFVKVRDKVEADRIPNTRSIFHNSPSQLKQHKTPSTPKTGIKDGPQDPLRLKRSTPSKSHRQKDHPLAKPFPIAQRPTTEGHADKGDLNTIYTEDNN